MIASIAAVTHDQSSATFVRSSNMKRPRTLGFVHAVRMPDVSSTARHSCCNPSWSGALQAKVYLATGTVYRDGRRAIFHMTNKESGEADDNSQQPEGVPNKDVNADMTVYRKNGRRRPVGELPFDVSIITPPPRYLGRFQLDPLTHCGDILEHDGHHFEVKVVRVRYRFREGRYKVVGKAVEVKSLARKAVEVYLERKFLKS